jgi:hypothetical protein
VRVDRGDLADLVDFMKRFYELRLLHQIRKLTVQRPMTAESRTGASTDLEINMIVEALVLDTAETRKTLVPEKVEGLQTVLAGAADEERKYPAIAGKNLFFGPPPRTDFVRNPVDFSPFVKLNGISFNGQGPTATLFDSYHNHSYKITPHSLGGYQVEVIYYLNQRERPLRNGKSLELYNEDGDLEFRWQVVRIDNQEMILRDDEKHYSLRVGQALSEMKTLTKAELGALGIKEEAPTGTKVEAAKEPEDK